MKIFSNCFLDSERNYQKFVSSCLILLHNETYTHKGAISMTNKSSTTIRISKSLAESAKVVAKAMSRSLNGQVEHWAKLGRAMEENPDLPFKFVKEILIAQEEEKAGMLKPYQFGDS